MHLLLDTHVFLWDVMGSAKLSEIAKGLMDDSQNQPFLSPVVYWEVAIKVSTGKLDLSQPYLSLFAHAFSQSRLKLLPIEIRHTSHLLLLPQSPHRDPFDRLLVAQALADGMTLVSADERLDEYAVPRAF